MPDGTKFQSSPTPRSGCYLGQPVVPCLTSRRVSILTHSEKRVLQVASPSPGRSASSGFNPHPLREAGATWSESKSCRSVWFQSSPTPRSGCYFRIRVAYLGICYEFQSSPTPRSGCYATPRPKLFPEFRFQSSPTPRSGCYVLSISFVCSSSRRFQSSPTPRSGCYDQLAVVVPQLALVSILTHSEKRVLQVMPSGCPFAVARLFQSSPTPRSGCYWVGSAFLAAKAP